MPLGGEDGGDRRADDEDRLVDHRLQRIGGLHLDRLPGQHERPASPDRRPDRGVRRTGHRGTQVGQPGRTARLDGPDQAADPRGEQGGDDREHPGLAEVVEHAPLHDGAETVGDGVRRGEAAGEAVRAAEAGHQQHDPEGVDRDRQPRHERRQAEAQGTGMAEHGPVAGEHCFASVGHDGLVSPTDVTPYDALLLVSFGGPDEPEDVVPFLENVTRGRGIPRERLEEVGEHYFLFGGKSPINEINRTLLAEIRADLAEHGIDVPVYWGNRNWDPYLSDVVAQMKADGVTRAACFTTSAYSSYSSCRQYRENLADAAAAVDGAPVLERLRSYWNHPGFVDPVVDSVVDAVRSRDRGPHRVRHPLDPRLDERRQRPPGRRLPGSAPGRGCLRRPPGRRGDRPVARPRPGLLLPLRAAPGALARARRQRPPREAGRRGGALGGAGADRLRVRPHGGRLRPRHRGAGDRGAARAGCRPGADVGHRPAVRGDGPRPARRAGRRRARRPGRPDRRGRGAGLLGRVRRRLLPQPTRDLRPALERRSE